MCSKGPSCKQKPPGSWLNSVVVLSWNKALPESLHFCACLNTAKYSPTALQSNQSTERSPLHQKTQPWAPVAYHSADLGTKGKPQLWSLLPKFRRQFTFVHHWLKTGRGNHGYGLSVIHHQARKQPLLHIYVSLSSGALVSRAAEQMAPTGTREVWLI